MESLKTILYFSIFNYPLKIEEIHNYTTHQSIEETIREIDFLIEQKNIQKIDDYYVYNSDFESVKKRIRGNIGAQKTMDLAKKRGHFISKFPFVKGVGISGSLSKGYFDENSDVDFFVITEPNRLWTTRTLLMLYKKIFLLNSRKYFCINYFISLENLEIEEKNRFTATEIKTLIPIVGKNEFKKFYEINEWTTKYFKNQNVNLDTIADVKKNIAIKGIEWILRMSFYNVIDQYFRKITLLKWKTKFKNMGKEDFRIALKSTQNVSKHHPYNFQKKVILALNEKYIEFYKLYNIELSEENA